MPRANHVAGFPPSSSGSTAASFRFDLVLPKAAYFSYLLTVREAIRACVSRCQCWSSIYDKCHVSKEKLLQERSRKAMAATKSLEMEDISSIKIQVSAEGEKNDTHEDGADDESHPRSAFRSRSTTLAATSSSRRLRTSAALRTHDKLHSRQENSSMREEEKMVAGGAEISSSLKQPDPSTAAAQHGLRRSGTISGGSRPSRSSPRLSRKAMLTSSSIAGGSVAGGGGGGSGQFEDSVGLFLKVVMDKLMDMMQHPPSVNILLTRLVSRLAHYPQPLLRSLLLNHQLVLKPGVPNLFTVKK